MSYESVIRRKKGGQDFVELKNRAAEFYQGNGIPQEVEKVLTELFLLQPGDLHGYLANHFNKLSAPPRISRVKGKEAYDVSGQLSIEADIFCIINNEEKWISCAAIPSYCGQETTMDGVVVPKDRAEHVTAALQWIDEPLSGMLKNLDPCDQMQVDRILSDFFMARSQEEKEKELKEKMESESPSTTEVETPSTPSTQTKKKKGDEKGPKGGSAEKVLPPQEPEDPVLPGSLAVGTLSLAVAKSGAQSRRIPLYKHIAALRSQEAQEHFSIPQCLVTLLSCGKASAGKLNLLEEVILVPRAGQGVKQIITMALEIQKEMMRIMNSSSKAGAVHTCLSDKGVMVLTFERPEQPLDLIAEACGNLEMVLGEDMSLALNCAAQDLMDYAKGKYEVAAGGLKSPDELVYLYQSLTSKYAVAALIDPLRKEDVDQWEKLSSMMGNTCALLTTMTTKLQASVLPGIRGHLVKHINEITVSDLISFANQNQGTVLMETCAEPCTEDAFVDMAVGLGLDYVKLGGLSGGERYAKYNRLIAIEKELAHQGILASWEEHRPPFFVRGPVEPSVEDTD